MAYRLFFAKSLDSDRGFIQHKITYDSFTLSELMVAND